MADLIARLRDTYRPTTSEQFQAESLNAIVEDVQRLIATHLRHSQVVFEFRPDPLLPAVSAIRDQLKQAVLNLSINAVEAMPGGGRLTVETRYAPEVDEVCLTLADTGQGIDPADLPNVFDPFFTTKASGTGLGLAITHDIARRHGGRLEVTSQLGRGTTFMLCLPVQGPPAGTGLLSAR
jgi:signal transduction histidine kinase